MASQFLLGGGTSFIALSPKGLPAGPLNRLQPAHSISKIFAHEMDTGFATFLGDPCSNPISFQILTSSGEAASSPKVVVQNKMSCFQYFGAAYNPLLKEYLLLIGGKPVTSLLRQLLAYRVNSQGNVIGTPHPVALIDQSSTPFAVFVGNHYLLVYGKNNVFIKELDSTAHAKGRAVQLNNSAGTFYDMRILFSSQSSRALVIWHKFTNPQEDDVNGRIVEFE